MVFTACEENGGIEEENGQKDPTEQPGNGENGGKTKDGGSGRRLFRLYHYESRRTNGK